MSDPINLDRGIVLRPGDCREVMQRMIDAGERVDAVVCDPPYHLTSIVQRFGADNAAPAKSEGATGVYGRASAGFMGKVWDGGDVAYRVETWRLAYELLKPGGHLVAFGGTRTHHRVWCAIEDAGFEIRDTLSWMFGTGFPKSHNVAKSIDKAARGVPHGGTDPTSKNHGKYKGGCSDANPTGRGFGAGPGQFMAEEGDDDDRPLVPEAQVWIGWGTALKPGFEPICLARKPLEDELTVAANVLKYSTGALNIDACRINWPDGKPPEIGTPGWGGPAKKLTAVPGQEGDTVERTEPNTLGRWPANICHDGSDEVVAAFPSAPGAQAPVTGDEPSASTANVYGKFKRAASNRVGEASADRRYTDEGGTNFAMMPGERRFDSGSAARFFYSAKADADDRCDSKHPTVKPVALMQWLVRLVTPPGGLVLDPFAGTGTTGLAALREGFRAVLIEREAEYQGDIIRRFKRLRGADTPLFGGTDAA